MNRNRRDEWGGGKQASENFQDNDLQTKRLNVDVWIDIPKSRL